MSVSILYEPTGYFSIRLLHEAYSLLTNVSVCPVFLPMQNFPRGPEQQMTEKPNSRARACVCGQAFQFLSLRVSIKNPLTVWKCSPLSLSLFVSLTGTRLFSLPAFLEGKKQKAKKEEEANEKKERKNKSRERREEADQ